MLDLPPGGTRGREIPEALRPLLRAMGWVGSLMMQLGMKIQGQPLLRLTTVGAKTGKRRQTVLAWFADESRDDAWLVVGSNGGSARHPGWAFNLARSPSDAWIDLGDGDLPVEAELLAGTDYEEAWDRVVELAAGYGRYEDLTDREIPIFRLKRHPDAPR